MDIITIQKNNLIKTTNIGKLLKIALFLPVFLFLFSLDLDNNFFSTASAADPKPVYVFWNTDCKCNIYTINQSFRNDLLKRKKYYKYLGIFFKAYENNETNTVPVFRLKHQKNKTYYYTISPDKRDHMRLNGWQYTGIAFYAHALSYTNNTTPVYHFKKSNYGAHFYTTSPGLKSCLTNYKKQWKYVGEEWRVPETGADLNTDTETCVTGLGPKIRVGLWEHTRDDLRDEAFKIDANRRYKILDRNGNLIAKVDGGTTTRVKYDGDKKFRVYNSIPSTLVYKEVRFEAADGKNNAMIFDSNRPSSDYDHYRGKIKLRYYDPDGSVNDRIWVINELPMEHYTWGNGELTGTGDMDYNRVMATVYRTYGYWKLLYSTQWTGRGFHVISTPANQIYKGYDYEKDHERIREASIYTKGKILKYGSKIALAPYSSWTDGRTRSFKERWGSSNYPWCKSVPDPYGKHPWMSTSELEAAGNHMVGISANGAVHLANEHGWSWTKILNYYLTNIRIVKLY